MMGLIGTVLGWFRQGSEAGAAKAPAKSEDTPDGVSEISEVEKEEAMALGKDPELLSWFLEDLEQLGVVGEESAKKQILLACISRLSSSPMSVTVKGQSSSGKNFVTGAVLRTLPPEDVERVSGMSAKALRYWKKDLSRKVVMIDERPGAESADYDIRVTESEGGLRFLIPERKGGRFETVVYEFKGRPVFIETTTKERLHSENETRRFDVHLDESPEQTRLILKAQRSHEKEPVFDEESILRRWRNLHRLLELCDVFVPYAEHVEFPGSQGSAQALLDDQSQRHLPPAPEEEERARRPSLRRGNVGRLRDRS